MEIEFEATFGNIGKAEMRTRLESVGAVLIYPERMQKRIVFNLPSGHDIDGGWLRVRDEGDKITMSLKSVSGEGITSQKEIELKVDNFETATVLLETIGCEKKAYQESKRELWELDNVEIAIDEWPFLEPFVEVEAKSEQEVKAISEKLSFDYNTALFDSVDAQYSKKYNITIDAVNQRTPEILFNMENPFINRTD